MSEVDVEALKLDLIGAYQTGSLTHDLVDDIVAALERAEKDRQHLREKDDIIRAYAEPGGMTPEDTAAALERGAQAEKMVRDAQDQDCPYLGCRGCRWLRTALEAESDG